MRRMQLPQLAAFVMASFAFQTQALEAQAPQYRWTGANLAEFAGTPPGVSTPEKIALRRGLRSEAQGYLDGLADVSEGAIWCSEGKATRAELDAQLITHLQTLPEQALGAPAFSLASEYLRSKYPCGQGTDTTPRWTGETLLGHVYGKATAPVKEEQAALQRIAAQGYLAGVFDASWGTATAGCPGRRIKSGELDADVIHGMRKMPSHLLSGSAAELAIRILRNTYPCP